MLLFSYLHEEGLSLNDPTFLLSCPLTPSLGGGVTCLIELKNWTDVAQHLLPFGNQPFVGNTDSGRLFQALILWKQPRQGGGP